MTRKRYCKLIMSQGHQRNAANMEARGCRLRGQSYSDHLAEIEAEKDGIDFVMINSFFDRQTGLRNTRVRRWVWPYRK